MDQLAFMESNGSSYSSLEANTQKERILKIIDDTITKSELSLCLPVLVQNNCELLQSWFKENEIDYIKETIQKYEKFQSSLSSQLKPDTSNNNSFPNIIRSESLKNGEQSLVQQVADGFGTADEDLYKVIQLLFDHQELRNISTIEKLSEGAFAFVISLKELRTCIANRLSVSPHEEMKRETELKELYKQNERDTEEVMKLRAKLSKQLAESKQAIAAKKLEIKKEQEKIEKVQKQCRDNIRKKREEAEKQINWDLKNSEFRLEELQSAFKISQYQKDLQLKEHLVREKELRIKRFKVESQLVAMLQKYDTDIGDRNAQLEEMTATFEKEKEEMIKLQECFDQQEIEYQLLMDEKEAYERKVWEAKLYEIQCKIAARKIQRFYRSYLAMCRAKGRKGKGKGKGKKKK